MLINSKTVSGYTLGSLDGEIGKVEEFLFDDQYWTVRYLVANTGGWLTGRQILIAPYALVAVDKVKRDLAVKLTKSEIEGSPTLESNKPVSRQFEQTYYEYYGWPVYWNGFNMWGGDAYLVHDQVGAIPPVEPNKDFDPHLRSTNAVEGYHIQATDGEIGHVEDFVIDDDTWAIRYLIVDTKNWRPGKRILLSPQWIDKVSWNESKVFVNLTRETIKQAPEYKDGDPITRSFEADLHKYYDRQGYWDAEPNDDRSAPAKKNEER